MKLNFPKFDPSTPLTEFPVLKTTDEILKFLKNAAVENAEQQTKQSRKNATFTWVNVSLFIVSIILAWLTLKATWVANASTNKQSQLESQLSQLEAKLSLYQADNDSLTTTVERMKLELERISGK